VTSESSSSSTIPLTAPSYELASKPVDPSSAVKYLLPYTQAPFVKLNPYWQASQVAPNSADY